MPSEATQVEVTPELLKLASKEKAKQDKRRTDAMVNAMKYKGVIDGSIEFDESAQKFSVEVKCEVTSVIFRAYTSDLFQIDGLCPEERTKNQKAKLAAKRERTKLALALLAKQEAKGE